MFGQTVGPTQSSTSGEAFPGGGGPENRTPRLKKMLVGGIPTPLKNMNQLGRMMKFPIC
jgi:hypothetical protein